MSSKKLASTPSLSLDITQEKRVLKATIMKKEKQLAEILEVTNELKQSVSDFEDVYTAKIGRLQDHLEYLERLLFKYNNIGDYVDDLLPFDEAEKIFEETMGDRRARMEDEYTGQRRENLFVDKRKGMTTSDREELKLLYRKLARIFHPDKIGGDEQMMIRINKAYQEGNLEELRDMNVEQVPSSNTNSISGLKYQILALDRLIIIAKRDLRALKNSDMHVLMKNLLKTSKSSTELVLDKLAKELRAEIHKKEDLLDQFREKFGLNADLGTE